MKYNSELVERIADWVRQNGVFPQKGGATQRSLCKQFGISEDQYKRWLDGKADFADAIKSANAHYAKTTEVEVYNALKRHALGYEYAQYEEEQGRIKTKRTEFDPVTGKKTAVIETESDKLVVVKATRKNVVVAPDTGAAIFLLTNLNPQNWKNRQNLDGAIGVDVKKPTIVFRDIEEANRKAEEERLESEEEDI